MWHLVGQGACAGHPVLPVQANLEVSWNLWIALDLNWANNIIRCRISRKKEKKLTLSMEAVVVIIVFSSSTSVDPGGIVDVADVGG